MITVHGVNKLTDIIINKTKIWKDMPEGTSKYLSSALYFALNNLSFNDVWWPNPMYTSVHIWRVILQRSTCDAHFLIEPLTDCNGFYVMCGTPENYILIYKAYVNDYRSLDYRIANYLIKKTK